MKIWRMLAALCLIGALVLTFVACGTTPEPSTEPTTGTADNATDATGDESQIPLVDPETFKDFVGTWYADGSSAGYRIIIKEDATWTFTDASEVTMFSGGLMVNEDNKSITLYDPDGVQSLDIKLDDAGKIYVDFYLESLMDTLNTNHFLNKITNNEANYTPFGEDDSAIVSPTEDASTGEIPADNGLSD